MKSTFWIVLNFFCAVILSSRAAAGIIAFDNFDYANGSLVPNGGWETHSGNVGDLIISQGEAQVRHGAPSEDVHLSFPSRPGDIYYGLDLNVSADSAITGSDSEYFAHFKDVGSNFAARLDIIPALGGGDFSLGIATDSSTADSSWATDLFFGISYRAIVKYDQIVNLAMLWIDATTSTDIFITGDDIAGPADMISQFALRQSDSNLNETVRIDNLVIGTSFDDVVRHYSVRVPEPSTLMLLLLGLVYLGFASPKPLSNPRWRPGISYFR